MLSKTLKEVFSKCNLDIALMQFEDALESALKGKMPIENGITVTFELKCPIYSNTAERYLNKKYPEYIFTVVDNGNRQHWIVVIIKK